MWDLIVFALIGLFTGAAARVCYPGREPLRILGTMVLGMAGALLGGLISWGIWPAADGRLYAGALLASLLGAVLAVVAWAGVAYARSISTRSDTAP
jgi:uncharacterized membrane protein YeaQ/YmgE (transglycosylase-associated protein family)